MTQFVFGLLAGIIVGLVMEWVIDWSGLFPKRSNDKRANDKRANDKRTAPRTTQTTAAPASTRVVEAATPVTLESNPNPETNED